MFTAFNDTAPNPGNLPVPRATVEEMERAREIAIARYGDAFDALADARRAGARACISQSEHRIGIGEKARDALLCLRERPDRAREIWIEEMTRATDQAMWDHLMRATDLERLMDRQARDEWRKSLKDNPPPATEANVYATLTNLVAQSGHIFRRGIATAFRGLDRRFRSHDGFKLGARIVLENALSEFGCWNHYRLHDETLRDVERAFAELDGQRQPERAAGIVGKIDEVRSTQARPVVVESDYFRVRIFKNGNIHIWFRRDDLVRKVNRVLADYFGEVIGAGADVADVSDMGPGYLVTPARNFGLFETNEKTAALLFGHLPWKVLEGATVLEPSAGRGALADRARSGGAKVQCVEVQHGLVAELRAKGHEVREGDFLAMTEADLPLFDVVIMNPPFDLGRDCDHVRHAMRFVKPGGVLVAIMSARTEYAEDRRAAAFRAAIGKWRPIDWNQPFRDLPEGSFAHAGTMINTVTLAIRTPANDGG
jgi:2-polyprenyl-3-methyl-5-hydroxy-6-metoxy-1,4-benzoquinol methylase